MASVNYKKCKRGSGDAGAIMRHSDRDERLKHEHSNEQIDKSRTSQNEQMWGYNRAVGALRERLAELDATSNTNRRKDRVEAFALETTVPDGVDARAFTDVVVGSIIEQYGRENLAAWYLHRDEVHRYVDHGQWVQSRPHIHAIVVPEHDGRLNGKWFSSREQMQRLNRTIDQRCRERFGVPFLTGGDARQQTVERLKAESARAERQLEEKQLDAARATLARVSDQIESQRRDLGALVSQYAALEERWVKASPDDERQRSPMFHPDKVIVDRDDYDDLRRAVHLAGPLLEADRLLEEARERLLEAEAKASGIKAQAAEESDRIIEAARQTSRSLEQTIKQARLESTLRNIQHDHPEMFQGDRYIGGRARRQKFRDDIER